MSKIDDQITQLDNTVDKITGVIGALNVSVSTICAPGDEYETKEIGCTDLPVPSSQLAMIFRDINIRLCNILQRINDINERIEL